MASKKVKNKESFLKMPNESCILGGKIFEAREQFYVRLNSEIEEIAFTWVDEVLVGIKESFAKPDPELCPKTPGEKKTRARGKRLRRQKLDKLDEDASMIVDKSNADISMKDKSTGKKEEDCNDFASPILNNTAKSLRNTDTSVDRPVTRGCTPRRPDASFNSPKAKSAPNRCSKSRRKSSTVRVSGIKSGLRQSLSSRRSSISRHIMRNEKFKEQLLTKKSIEQKKEIVMSAPDLSTPSTRSKLKLKKTHNIASIQMSSPVGESDSDIVASTPEPPQRVTRSKMRKIDDKKPVDEKAKCDSSKKEPRTVQQNESFKRTRQSDSDEPYSPKRQKCVESTSNNKSLTRTPSQKEYKNDEEPKAVEKNDSYKRTRQSDNDEEPKAVEKNDSYKRTRQSDSDEPPLSPKRQKCAEGSSSKSQAGTPSHKGARIAKAVKGGSVVASITRKLLNLNTTTHSFINRNTPLKKSVKEAEEERRKMLEAKEKQAQSRLLQREELQHKRREELRRNREERQKQVAKRREQQEKKDQNVKLGIFKKMESTKDLSSKLLEEKLKEEREKQKLREKKVQEAEQRRKQEEEQRLQALHEKQMEEKKHQEMLQKKRELEEQERVRKEQRRLEEQKRLEQERHQQLEEDRKRALLLEQERLRDETERREREERERKERSERERQERIRLEEVERQRQEELKKKRDAERQKLIAQKTEQALKAKVHSEEERKVLAMIQKHNDSLQHSNDSSTSKNTSILSSATKQTLVNSQKSTTVGSAINKLNSSYTLNKPVGACLQYLQEQHKQLQQQSKDDSSTDSYEITPKRVYKQNSQGENYNIEDLRSDDSTDDEDKPRKVIPSWAQGAQLKAALINQHYQPPDLDDIFDTIIAPDLNILFTKKRTRFNKRTSSARWDSPILKPSGKLPSPK